MKKWMKVMPIVCMMFLCSLAFPQKANAAQVSLSVGDTTTVTLPDKASTIVSSQWSIAGNTDAVTITSRSKTSCTIKAVQASGSVDAIVHCKYMLSGSAAWHLYDKTVSVGGSSGGSSGSSSDLVGWCYFSDGVNSVELDLAKPEGIDKQIYYTGDYSSYSPNKWECQQSGDGFQMEKISASSSEGRYAKYTFTPVRIGTYTCTLSYYARYYVGNGPIMFHKIGEKTFPVTVTCSHSAILQGYKQETADTDGYTGDKVCAFCGEVLEEGVVVKTIASGKCGDNLTWRLNDQGVLRIEGKGAMDDFEESPWHSHCSSIQTVEIGEQVSSIGDNSFSDCTLLEKIVIPENVVRVGSSAFSGCTGLSSIYFQGDAPQIATDAFGEISAEISYISVKDGWLDLRTDNFGSALTWKDATYDYGDCGENAGWILDEHGTLFIHGTGAMSDYDYTRPWSVQQVKKVVVGKGITRIGDKAFYNCGNLEAVDLPQSVTEIGTSAFQSCANLQTIELPVGLVSIKDSAFSGCKKIPSVEFGAQLTTIGNSAFSSCILISEVEIPYSVTDIGNSAFRNCTLLKKVTFRGNAPEIQASAFGGVTAEAFYSRMATGWVGSVRVDYGGTLTWTQYEGVPISRCTVTMAETEFPYTGEEVRPEVVVTDGDVILENGTDYSVCYSDCIESGEATVTVVGKGTYIGAATQTYRIVFFIDFNANGGTVDAQPMAVVNGSAYGNLPTPEREDYKFDGWYTAADGGENITNESIVSLASNQTLYAHWTKKAQKPDNPDPDNPDPDNPDPDNPDPDNPDPDNPDPDNPSHPGDDKTVTKLELSDAARTLWIGEEFTLTATTTPAGAEVTWSSNNESVATVTAGRVTALAKGTAVITAWAGDLTETCEVTVETEDSGTKTDLRDAIVTVADCTYNREAQMPEVGVRVNGRVLIKNTDYTVSYENNINAGTAAKVIITAKEGSNYTGSTEQNFTIRKARAEITASNLVKTAGDKDFTLGAVVNSGAKLSYQSGNAKVLKIINGRARIVDVGTAAITITAAANDNYEGAVKTITVRINRPKTAVISKAVSKKKGQMKVIWKKDAKASGYKVMYSTDKKFKNKKVTVVKNIKKKTTGNLTVKGLKRGKAYYVKVCSYAKIGKKEIPGKYSRVKKVKIK